MPPPPFKTIILCVQLRPLFPWRFGMLKYRGIEYSFLSFNIEWAVIITCSRCIWQVEIEHQEEGDQLITFRHFTVGKENDNTHQPLLQGDFSHTPIRRF